MLYFDQDCDGYEAYPGQTSCGYTPWTGHQSIALQYAQIFTAKGMLHH